MMILQNAYSAIRSGECSAALVVSCNICLVPEVTRQFFEVGVLSMDGKSKSFDVSGECYKMIDILLKFFPKLTIGQKMLVRFATRWPWKTKFVHEIFQGQKIWGKGWTLCSQSVQGQIQTWATFSIPDT